MNLAGNTVSVDWQGISRSPFGHHAHLTPFREPGGIGKRN